MATQAALSLQTALCRLQARLDDCLQRNTKQLVLRVQALARGFIVSPCHGQPRGYNAIVPFRVCEWHMHHDAPAHHSFCRNQTHRAAHACGRVAAILMAARTRSARST